MRHQILETLVVETMMPKNKMRVAVSTKAPCGPMVLPGAHPSSVLFLQNGLKTAAIVRVRSTIGSSPIKGLTAPMAEIVTSIADLLERGEAVKIILNWD